MLALASRAHPSAATTIQKHRDALAIVAVVALVISILLIRKSYMSSNNIHFRYFYLLGASCLLDLGFLVWVFHKLKTVQGAAPGASVANPVVASSYPRDPIVDPIVEELQTYKSDGKDDLLFGSLWQQLWDHFIAPGVPQRRTLNIPQNLEARLLAHFDRMSARGAAKEFRAGEIVCLPSESDGRMVPQDAEVTLITPSTPMESSWKVPGGLDRIKIYPHPWRLGSPIYRPSLIFNAPSVPATPAAPAAPPSAGVVGSSEDIIDPGVRAAIERGEALNRTTAAEKRAQAQRVTDILGKITPGGDPASDDTTFRELWDFIYTNNEDWALPIIQYVNLPRILEPRLKAHIVRTQTRGEGEYNAFACDAQHRPRKNYEASEGLTWVAISRSSVNNRSPRLVNIIVD